MACDGEILVSLVEKRPSIYDFGDKDHSNRIVQDKLWEEISKEMDVDVSVCKSKWTSLRNSFARELRELKNKKSGSAGSKKRKWYLFDSMSFLTGFMMQHKKMGSNIDNDYLNESEEIIESGEDDTLVVDNTGDNNIVDNTVIESERDIIEPIFKTPKLTLHKKTTASDKVAEPMIEFLKSRTRKPAPVEEPPELLFFKSLIPDYKKLNDKHQRKFKHLVMSSLNSYLDEQEDNNQTASFQNNINNMYHIPVEEQSSRLYQARPIMEQNMNYPAGQINQNQNVNNYYSDFASDLSSSSLESNSSSSLDYVDSEDSYKPFNEDNYSIKNLEPPNDSIFGTLLRDNHSNNTMKKVCEHIDKQDTVCRRRLLYNDLPDSTCGTSNQPMPNETEEASSIQLIPSCSNVILQDNVLLLDNENIIHCNTTNTNIEVITNNKQRYIGGKRKCMNNRKQLREEYEDREDCPSNWLYRDVFGETGLKFKLPYVDTCKTCDEFNIKSKYLNGEELELLTERNNIHKDMFDSAYKSKQEDKALLNTTPALKIIVFDLQQCLPTPDLKTNVVFYKRQLWTYNETIRDIGSKESYCYMWHEGLAGRGSNEIDSILYKYIMEKIPNSINHLITYSDTCAGQNRNINVAIMFMLAIQKHPTLQIIDQKFLVPGHTHLECDSDHSRIEKAKKLSDCEISIPIDWYNFVRNVRGKIPLKVVEMEMEHFKKFSALLSGTLIKRNIDENKEKINWLKISWLRYDKSFGIIQFKNSLDTEAPFRKLDIRKITGKTRSGKEPTDVSQVILPQAYNKPNLIDTEKKMIS
ncbi:hypothetical protein ACI65C_006406 [Semiaphis heraclei]